MSLLSTGKPDAPHLLNDLLSKPIQFGEVVHKSSFAPGQGVREVMPGPKSPLRGLLNLEPPVPKAVKPATAGVAATRRVSNGHVNGMNGASASAGPSTPAKDRTPVHHSASTPNGNHSPAVANGVPLSAKQKGKARADDAGATSSPATANAKALKNLPNLPNMPATNGSKTAAGGKALYAQLGPDDLAWPDPFARAKRPAAGLHNPSMACYANATLQVIMHTPPFLRIAKDHSEETCKLRIKKDFCALCVSGNMLRDMHWSKKAYTPEMHRCLSLIKKGFSRNRQEDAHEFFRFLTDAFQNEALFGYPKDLPNKLKHTTWVHRIWGGMVRSRVVCSRCLKPSDTFDHFLDLSLDVNPGKGPKSVESMLQGFIKEDRLDGDNKYSCENCKAKANATKSFRILTAPPVLTLHLKRFSVSYNTYSGRPRADKFNQHIAFPEQLDLAPYMVADGKSGKAGSETKYRLFGVTCHRGVELRFGHYTSYVRGPAGQWFNADDDMVVPVPLREVQSDKTAYLLSYIRVDEGAAVQKHGLANGHASPMTNGVNGHAAANGHSQAEKRKRADEDEDGEEEEEESEDEDEDEQEQAAPSTSDLPSNLPRPKIRPSTPPAQLFPSRLDPSFSSSSKPGTPSSSKILAPRPLAAGESEIEASPISRPAHPSPSDAGDSPLQSPRAERRDRGDRDGERGGKRKKRKHLSSNLRKMGGAPMPFAQGSYGRDSHGKKHKTGGGGGGGMMGKPRGAWGGGMDRKR